MPVGFQAVGEHGAIQIDQDFRNFHFSQVKSVYCGSAEGNVFYGVLEIGGLSWPMLGIYESDGACFRTIVRSGDYGMFRVYRKTAGWVNIAVFDLIPPTGLGCGLQVFDASGEVVFDSGGRYMRVLDHRAGQGTYGYGVSRVAVVPVSQYIRADFLPNPNPDYYNVFDQGSFFSASGNVINVSEATMMIHTDVFNQSRPAYETFNHQLLWMAVDASFLG